MTVWFITGCSCRFGREIAFAALKRGDKVIATASNLSSILDLQLFGAKIVALDFSEPDADIKKAVNEVLKNDQRVDILVHSPGTVLFGMFEEISAQDFRGVFNTNFFGQVSVTQAIIPYMRPKKSGIIAFMGAIEGWASYPTTAAWVASKWAIAGLAQGVRDELQPLDIKVTVIEAGDFQRELFKPEKMSYVATDQEEYREHMKHIKDITNETLTNSTENPANAADLIVQALVGEGPFQGKSLPARLVLGCNSVHAAQKILSEQTESLTESYGISRLIEPLYSKPTTSDNQEKSYFG